MRSESGWAGVFLLAVGFATATGADRPPPTVAVEILATDLKGQPAAGVVPNDLEIHQDGVLQTITHLAPADAPGAYEVRFVPSSGRPGALTMRSARKGLLVRGPRGGDLRPRVIPTPTALEAELLALADGPAAAASLPVEAAVLRFGAQPRGGEHVVALEVAQVALAQLGGGASSSALQIVARLRRQGGGDDRLTSHERPLGGLENNNRIVWTSYYVLSEGTYTLDLVAREAATRRHAARRIEFSVPAASSGLRLSSLVFLQPGAAQLLTEPVAGDPLVHEGVALLPTLALTLPYQVDARARFYVLVYPDPGDNSAVSLALEVLRGDQPVGTVPLRLPAAEGGRIAFVGELPTRTFREAAYRLRLVARQGSQTVTEEGQVRIETIRIGPPALPP